MATQLVGAFRLTPGALEPAHRSAMLAQLERAPQVVEGPGFWLAGEVARRRGEEAFAAVGLLTRDGGHEDDDAQLDALCAGAPLPEGQFAAARRNADGRLILSRSLSGGERLYVTRIDGAVLFSSSVRPLLAHPEVERGVDVDVLRDLLLNGHPLFGQATALAGIDEVQPGCQARFGLGSEGSQRWFRDDVLASPEGDLPELARQFRERLREAVALAIGKERPVAIALSGGIDSSAIAAAAVEVVEASQIRTYSWEFDDPTHPVETDYARRVVRALGLPHHEVFSIDAPRFLEAIPEHVWRSESAVHWPKAFLLVAGQELRARGHERYLTGFGIGSHMQYLRELMQVLRWLPSTRWLPSMWKRARFGLHGWPHWLERLHPGLEPPHPRLYGMLAEVFCREGLIADHRAMFPAELAPLLHPRARTTGAGGRGIGQRLQRQAFSHLVSCIDVTRSEKAAREIGIHRIAPAHFGGCLPYAYFPISPAPPPWSADRRHRPGKLLLKHAYRGILPDEVLFRVKDWADAVISPNWRRRARVHMLRALPHYPGDLARYDPALPECVEWWEPRSIQANCLSQRLWLELFAEQPPRPRPPTWGELWNVPGEGPSHEAFVAG